MVAPMCEHRICAAISAPTPASCCRSGGRQQRIGSRVELVRCASAGWGPRCRLTSTTYDAVGVRARSILAMRCSRARGFFIPVREHSIDSGADGSIQRFAAVAPMHRLEALRRRMPTLGFAAACWRSRAAFSPPR